MLKPYFSPSTGGSVMAQRRHCAEKHVPSGGHCLTAVWRHVLPDGEQDAQPACREQRTAVRSPQIVRSAEPPQSQPGDVAGKGEYGMNLSTETWEHKLSVEFCVFTSFFFSSFLPTLSWGLGTCRIVRASAQVTLTMLSSLCVQCCSGMLWSNAFFKCERNVPGQGSPTFLSLWVYLEFWHGVVGETVKWLPQKVQPATKWLLQLNSVSYSEDPSATMEAAVRAALKKIHVVPYFSKTLLGKRPT